MRVEITRTVCESQWVEIDDDNCSTHDFIQEAALEIKDDEWEVYKSMYTFESDNKYGEIKCHTQ